MNTQTLTLSGITTYTTSFIPTGTSNLTLPSGNDTLVGQSSLSSYQTVANMSNYAPINNPSFTGVPSAPTATAGTNTTQLATTAFVLANSSGSGTNILPLNNTWTGVQTIRNNTAGTGTSAVTQYNIISQFNATNPTNNVEIGSGIRLIANSPASTYYGGEIVGSASYGTDAYLKFNTYNNGGIREIMRLTATNGYCGIGTTNPAYTLDVNGTIRSNSALSLTSTLSVNGTQTSTLGFGFGGGSVGTQYRWKIDDITLNRDNGAGPNFDYGAQSKLIFSAKSNNLYSGGVNDQAYIQGLTLVPNSGGNGGLSSGINVGIGTTNPGYPLQIHGSSGTFLKLVNNTTGYQGGQSNIEFWNNNAQYPLAKISSIDVATSPNAYQSALSFSVDWNTAFLEGMRLIAVSSSQVNVGINKTNPASTLDVNGTARIGTSSANNVHLNTTPGIGERSIWMTYSGTGLSTDFGILQVEHQNTSYRNLALNPYGANVGIGKTNPAYTLDVNGAINCTGGILLNTTNQTYTAQLGYTFTNSSTTAWSTTTKVVASLSMAYSGTYIINFVFNCQCPSFPSTITVNFYNNPSSSTSLYTYITNFIATSIQQYGCCSFPFNESYIEARIGTSGNNASCNAKLQATRVG